MIRKLLLPLAAVALLGGCVTSGYGYRPHGGGDYYGAPSVDYRYYSPYGSYYGGAYGYYGQPYSYGYGSAYGYVPYYYGNQYYYYYPQPVYYPRPVERPQVDPRPDSDASPWRDLERLRARARGDRTPAPRIQSVAPHADPSLSGRDSPRRRPVSVGTSMPMPQPRISVRPPQPRSVPTPRSDGGAISSPVRRMRKGDPSTESAP